MKQTYLTVTDQFCGAGGSSIGATAAGMELKLALNHWKLAIETHNSNFPDAAHDCTDISACDPRRYPSTDLLITSPECFVAGTLILTKRGLSPIEDVLKGDEVFTHRSRWRSVNTVMSSVSSTVIVKGQGHYGLEVTPGHPFLAREVEFRNKNKKLIHDPYWCEASALGKGKFWASPILNTEDPLPIPDVGGRGAIFCPDFWWMVGKWLADGVVTQKQDGAKHIRISCSHPEADEVYRRINFNKPSGYHASKGEYSWSREIRDRQVLMTTSHQGLGGWLTEHFGKMAHGKHLPSWALTMPYDWRQALLEGYLFGDASYYAERGQYKFATVSKQLAVGIRLLALSLGFACTLSSRLGGQRESINGIEFERKTQYYGSFVTNAVLENAIKDDSLFWFRISSVLPGSTETVVYNLSVEEDESYIADGIVVHNCTNHSIAKGRSRQRQFQADLFGKITLDPAEERSRATMFDVPRFAEYHKYNIIVVENVVDARSWVLWEAWLHAMTLLGYDHQCVFFNSMFAWPTPQSRDRMYVVFWRKGNKAPNLDFRPLAHCPQCAKNVEAVQVWRNPHKRFGRYGKRNQYVYCCPACDIEVTPYYYCAANAIDWSLPAQRIGDRPRPLKDKTLNRIRIGLEKFGREAHLVDFVHSGHDPSKVRPVGQPWPTQIGNVCHGLVQPPFVTDLAYTHAENNRSTQVTSSLPTQTSRQTQGLVVPPYLVDLRGENTPKELIDALSTICASGNHHGLVMPFLLSYYTRNSGLGAAVSGVEEPVPTQPTWAVHYLTQPGQTPAVEDCGFRMLQPHEIQTAMGFPGNYTVLGDGRARVKQLGNAVTPPVMQMLIERCVATLS